MRDVQVKESGHTKLGRGKRRGESRSGQGGEEAEAEAEAETEEEEAEAEAETRCREGLGLANDEEDAAVVNKESGGKKRGEPRVPAGSVGLKAVV